jgi:hypothetical protein
MSSAKARSKENWLPRLVPVAGVVSALAPWTLRALLAAAIVGGVLGSLEVEKRLRRDDRFHLETWQIQTGELPAWVTDDIRTEIESLRLVGTDGPLSLFAPGVLTRVQSALENSPWIKSVTDMQVRYPTFEQPGALVLEMRLRKPVALIEQHGAYYLADAEATRLGAPYGTPPVEWFGVPAITGFDSSGAAPEPGKRWESRDVLQGVEVARVLAESGVLNDFPDQLIETIDLSNLHGRISPRESEIVLWRGRQRLAWGRSPISVGPRTVSVPQLVANLRHVLERPEAYAHLSVIHLHRRPEALTGVRG